MIAARPSARIVVAGGVLALLALAVVGFPHDLTGVAFLAPAILLFALLWRGYPGSRLLIALRRPPRSRGQRSRRRRPLFALVLPRGGRLLAAALAGRAPPSRP